MNENNNHRDVIEIDLQKLLLAYLRKWWLIVLCGVLTAGMALLYTMNFVTPQYRASVTIYVNNSRAEQQIDYVSSSNLATAQRLVNTYVNIIKSNSVLTEVIANSDLDCEPADIRRIMSAAQMDETEMFTVSITHPAPEMAAKIANAIADVAPGKIADIVEGSSTKIIDYAKVPTARYSPSYRNNTILGGLAGVVLAVLYVTVRHLMDVRLKIAEDLEQLFEIPVLGQIPVFDIQDAKKKSGYGKNGYGYDTVNAATSDKKESGVQA